jgi:A/G-specific adenine glycosylase
MLRRTQADQVVPVFEEFMRRFPSLTTAAQADPGELERLLWPLGLAWRARSMVAFLREAHARFGDDLPLDVGQLRSLPGIGDYVGAAIVCFAGGQPEPLIDTNVVRVLGRIFGLSTAGEARRRADMRGIAGRAVHGADPAAYHYGLLDFGAKVCVARRPRCQVCPFSVNLWCDYYRSLTEAAPRGLQVEDKAVPPAASPPATPAAAGEGRL